MIKNFLTEPDMTLQDLVEEMQEYHAETGAYRPEDVYRLIGDPRRGIGLNAFEAILPENYSNSASSSKER